MMIPWWLVNRIWQEFEEGWEAWFSYSFFDEVSGDTLISQSFLLGVCVSRQDWQGVDGVKY